MELDHYAPTPGWELPDADKAIERLMAAIEGGENILIFGDFDVDGITGTSVLYDTLRHLNANVSYYIPDRATEGHGLNAAALMRLVSSRKVKLVISTDTGITNFSEVSLLNGLGVDTIITDHHELPENLPPSVANVNPKLLEDQSHPLAGLAGVGVAFKLCELLLEAMDEENAELVSQRLLDLVAIGTVADLAPLQGENRYLVHQGLPVIASRGRLGLQAILEAAGVAPEAKIMADTVGFTIGPRLNAIGRLSNATEAVELLTTQDAERARQLAAHLEQLNRKRQELCDKTMLEAEQYLNATGGLEGRKAIILGSPEWNPGIIGIVASRLIDKYHVPVFMMTTDEENNEVRCSARSIPGFHMHDELKTLEQYFTGFGGHGGAAGFKLPKDRLNAFKEALYKLTYNAITDEQMLPVLEVDDKLEWSQINPHLVELLERLAPYGYSNPSPKFVLENVSVGSQRALGDTGRHLRLVLKVDADNTPLEAMLWNGGLLEPFDSKAKYHFAVTVERNTYSKGPPVRVIVEDFRLAEGSKKASASVEVTQVAPAVATVPKLVAKTAETPAEVGPNWVDHRSRERLEQFVGQLMLPVQQGRTVLLYHEGRAPQIPFLDAGIVSSRYQLKAAEELIFWDLPPDLPTLARVLSTVSPKTIHLAGGKYQSVPVQPVAKDFIKVVFQAARKLVVSNEMIRPEALASQLSTTVNVVLQGLVILDRLQVVQMQVEQRSGAIRVMPGPQDFAAMPPDALQALASSIEWLAFHRAVTEVGRVRQWLMSAPLDPIKRLSLTFPAVADGPFDEDIARHDIVLPQPVA
jgi:single-stranded-DNA-specific exonuclease RecJ